MVVRQTLSDHDHCLVVSSWEASTGVPSADTHRRRLLAFRLWPAHIERLQALNRVYLCKNESRDFPRLVSPLFSHSLFIVFVEAECVQLASEFLNLDDFGELLRE